LRAVAALMSRSKREIPHYYLAHTVDMGPAASLLAARNAGRPPASRLVATALALRALALAARDVPEMNGHHTEEGFVPAERVNVGLAVSMRGGGVVAPAILDADRLEVEELMERLRDVAERARRGRLRSSEMTEGTITLSSLGERSVEEVQGVIFHPQVALVGAGSVLERPWVVEGRVVPRPLMRLTLAADHRVSDGRRGGRFLARMAALLESPESL
jgi:pyruvate dehydrogenase E2 component (dihydrolipoamide acetyltransferase)